MSQTIDDEEQRRDCLKRVLKFDPNHFLAKTHLDLIENPKPSSTPAFSSPPTSPFISEEDYDYESAHQPSMESSPSQTLSATFEPQKKSVPAFTDYLGKESKSSPAKKTRPAKKKQKISKGMIALVLILFCLGIAGISYFGYVIYIETNSPHTPTITPTPLPTFTPKPTFDIQPTVTASPTSTIVRLPTMTPYGTPADTSTPIYTFTPTP